MSLDDLDRLLQAKPGDTRKRKKKQRPSPKQTAKAKSDAKLNELARAATRVQEWRLTAEPVEVRIWVQQTHCHGCGATHECPMSSPMIGYRDRLGRTHYRPFHVMPRSLPVRISRTPMQVPACQNCAEQQADQATESAGQPLPEQYQIWQQRPRDARVSRHKALVPTSQTPQALWWLINALPDPDKEYDH